jgi:spore germination cell wall hydrolase CwlJ-like protein
MYKRASLLTLLLLAQTNVGDVPVKEKVLTKTDQEQILCLAKNVYYESRGESVREQTAVAAVTINRTKDRRYPNTICGVVYQPKQFSWTIGYKGRGKPMTGENFQAIWKLSEQAYFGEMVLDPTNGATHYYSHKMLKRPPVWAKAGYQKVSLDSHTYMKL